MRKFGLLCLVFALSIAGCTKNPTPSEPALNLVVASSVGPAAHALAAKLEKSHGIKINVQAGASSLIARQIANGMACDVVMLADDEWMDYLAKQSAIETSTRKPYLGNRLVSIAHQKNGKELLKSERIAIADPEHVPAGKYAKKALLALGIWNQVSPKIVPAPDVRTALLWVERGEVDSGIVYESDAMSSRKVVIQTHFDDNPNHPIRYPIAQCRSKNARAKDLYQLLSKSDAVEIFRSFGFQIVKSAHEPT